MKIIHHRACVYSIGYHVVFFTKYRKKLITESVDLRLKEILLGIAADKGFGIANIGTGLGHVHMFISATPHVSVSSIVKWIKGVTVRKLLMDPVLKNKMSNHFCRAVGDMSVDAVQKYIDNKREVGD